MNRIFAVVATICCLGPSTAVRGAECEGVKYPDRITVEGQSLVLNGLGLREATFMEIDVYVAALYLPAKTRKGGEAIAQKGPKRLELHFVRDVDKEDIVEAWDQGFEKNAGKSLDSLKDRIAKLNGWTVEMKEGRKMIFTYMPGKGVEVKVGNTTKGLIPGEDFMKVFFSIWLGSKPPNPGLRVGLLGGSCE